MRPRPVGLTNECPLTEIVVTCARFGMPRTSAGRVLPFAARALRDLLGRHAGPEAAERVCLVMSGGTEGGLSPHVTVFE
ncbi:ring-opening amidohydrolase, partial [Methylobacterium sp. WL119]|uniref:ring-opening amidohydrolase n=1 Tax=Methylobacterium sp. WL119 TaxID=2603888 RepID=UPI0032B1ED23